MSTDPSTAERSAPAVVAVVLAADAEGLEATIASIAAQVYDPLRIVVVGGGDAAKAVAATNEAEWLASQADLLGHLGTSDDLVWIVRSPAVARFGALANLVAEMLRTDASVAGSKVLRLGQPRILESVGFATDAYGTPYSGLQEDELDQEQYDVIRDVATVAATSLIVWRDLFMGLKGFDTSMAPFAATLDLCQRARLRGGRVVVVPSSEVEGPAGSRFSWRERAGQLRAMTVAYSPLTLLWVIPTLIGIGLLEAVMGIFAGKWRLTGTLLAWGWNLVRLPTLPSARWAARRGRVFGDDELMRYQIGGSEALRGMADMVQERYRERWPEGLLSEVNDAIEGPDAPIKRPALIMSVVGIVVALIATRGIWAGALPAVGFTLPPPDSAVDTLRAYAGGWNPAGLGSPEVLRPSVGAVGVVQWLVGGNGGVATALLTIGAALFALYGSARLARIVGISSVAGYAAGLVLIAGPAARALGEGTHWSALVAAGFLPWAIGSAVAPLPQRWLGRVGRFASLILTSGLAAVFAPVALAIPVIAGLAWAAVAPARRIGPPLRALIGAGLAFPMLFPWALYVDAADFLTTGSPAYWNPNPLESIIIGLLFVAVVVVADRSVVRLGLWGSVLAALGIVAARSSDLGGGRELEVGGLLLLSVGLAILTMVGFETAARRQPLFGWRNGAAVTAGLLAGALAITTAWVALPGRLGLPTDKLTDQFDFITVAETPAARVLMFGPEATLPGESRVLDGLPYRVVPTPLPRSWDAYLNEPRVGDEALHGVLEDVLAGNVLRVGSRLADFGVGWVVFTEESPLQDAFESQLDLVRLRSITNPVFRNEVPAARAIEADGTPMVPTGTGYVGERNFILRPVTVAENADFRWGPGEWSQEKWFNVVTPIGNDVSFAGYGPRRALALGALAWALLLGITAVGAGIVRRR